MQRFTVIAVLILSVGVPAVCLAGGFTEAEWNFSSYEVRVRPHEGVTPLFVDYLDSEGDLYGMYVGYAVIFREGHAPTVLKNVLVVAVKATIDAGPEEPLAIAISKVYWHELVHHRQAERLGYWEYATRMAREKRECGGCQTNALEREAYEDANANSGMPLRVRLGKSKEPALAKVVFQ